MKSNVIATLPKTFRSKGSALIDFLKLHGIRWDRDHRLVIEDSVVPNSNFTDLIHDMLRYRESIAPPPGFQQLCNALRRVNISRELIGNSQRYEAIKNGQNEKSNTAEKDANEIRTVQRVVQRARKARPKNNSNNKNDAHRFSSGTVTFNRRRNRTNKWIKG